MSGPSIKGLLGRVDGVDKCAVAQRNLTGDDEQLAFVYSARYLGNFTGLQPYFNGFSVGDAVNAGEHNRLAGFIDECTFGSQDYIPAGLKVVYHVEELPGHEIGSALSGLECQLSLSIGRIEYRTDTDGVYVINLGCAGMGLDPG